MKARGIETAYHYDIGNYASANKQIISAENQPLKSESAETSCIYTPVESGDNTALMSVVHEIRNPLTNINLSLACLSSENLSPDLINHLEIINRSTRRISDLVTVLLKTPRSSSAQETFSVTNMLTETLLLSSDRARLKNISIETDFCPIECPVTGNKPKLIMALSNIIINALEAVNSRNGKLKIKTEKKESHCVISITDNGNGIARKDLKQIFSPYFTRKRSGTGIGLSVTKQILNNHNAVIHVDSRVGKGTCFTIIMELSTV